MVDGSDFLTAPHIACNPSKWQHIKRRRSGIREDPVDVPRNRKRTDSPKELALLAILWGKEDGFLFELVAHKCINTFMHIGISAV